MAKTVVKEIIIGLLLCLAILLILAVLMYSFIPNNKVIPEMVTYKAPDEAKKVLEESTMDTSQVILTYEVNSSDLSTAQRTNDYNPGKVNPFSSYQVQQATNEDGTPISGGTNNTGSGTSSSTAGTTNNAKSGATATGGGSSSTSGSTGTSSSTGGTYYKDKGTK